MKKLNKTITGLIMTSILFSIVSCIGMAEDDPTHIYGTVIDKETGEALENIRVTCGSCDQTHTDSSGEFGLSWEECYCEYVDFQDIDGENNGGPYEDQTLEEYLFEEDDITVEMELEEE